MEKQSINIMGIVYNIEYVTKHRDVDIEGKKELLAQIEHMGRTIRIFDDGLPKKNQDEYPFFLLIHEMLHGIASCANIPCLNNDDSEEAIDTLATVLADTLIRNDMVKKEWVK